MATAKKKKAAVKAKASAKPLVPKQAESVANDTPEPEAPVDDIETDLLVQVIAENVVFGSKQRQNGEQLYLANEGQFNPQMFAWVNRTRKSMRPTFNKVAVPGTYRDAMQKIAMSEAENAGPSKPLA